jgi:hypothetical protein
MWTSPSRVTQGPLSLLLHLACTLGLGNTFNAPSVDKIWEVSSCDYCLLRLVSPFHPHTCATEKLDSGTGMKRTSLWWGQSIQERQRQPKWTIRCEHQLWIVYAVSWVVSPKRCVQVLNPGSCEWDAMWNRVIPGVITLRHSHTGLGRALNTVVSLSGENRVTVAWRWRKR